MFLARILTHRFSLIVMNIFFIILSFYSLEEAVDLAFENAVRTDELDDIFDGLGCIFIAYGVALEGREILMKFFRLYPKYLNEKEEVVDAICENYGLLLLITGLCMEVAAELVVIPTQAVNVENVELGILIAGFAFWLIAVYLLVRMIYLFSTCKFKIFPSKE